MARFLAAAAAAATGVQVGSAMVATRVVVDQTGPTSLALLRYAIGFCCLLPVVWLSAGPVRFARRDVLPMALLGITQFGILIALLNYGLRFIPSARAALIFATFPLLTMVLAAALGHERLTLPKILGVLLTIAGVGVALGEKALQGGGAQEWVGELAVFASALSGAVCSVLYRPYLRKYPALPVSAFAMLASVGFLAILAAGEGFFASPPRFTPGGWLAIVFIGLSSGVGYYLWLWALGHAPATQVTVFLALSPITAAGLGALFLGEAISGVSAVGLACVALGLWLAHWRAPAQNGLDVIEHEIGNEKARAVDVPDVPGGVEQEHLEDVTVAAGEPAPLIVDGRAILAVALERVIQDALGRGGHEAPELGIGAVDARVLGELGRRVALRVEADREEDGVPPQTLLLELCLEILEGETGQGAPEALRAGRVDEADD